MKTITILATVAAMLAGGCHVKGTSVPSAMKSRITEYFRSRGGEVAKSRIYYDREGVLTMSDGTTTVECYPDGSCRECGDK